LRIIYKILAHNSTNPSVPYRTVSQLQRTDQAIICHCHIVIN